MSIILYNNDKNHAFKAPYIKISKRKKQLQNKNKLINIGLHENKLESYCKQMTMTWIEQEFELS